ncbi:MAG: cobyrinate a,c-diamide synthase [Lachnospiraceae bacterium]|nr:cobyrinate a,c-diamide synthase [Lachnospiraceae bacterium]
MTKMNTPRIMFAGTGSGCGKTMITCLAMAEYLHRELKISGWKCGPDYIDPMFHRKVLGIPTGNLDAFFCEEPKLRSLLASRGENTALQVIEGVMGYYDGIGDGSLASSAHIAKLTDTPVILIINGKGMSASIRAVIQGFKNYQNEGAGQIKGILLNRVSGGVYEKMAPYIRKEGLVPVGYIPDLKEHTLESRHLGLIPPEEIPDFKERLERLRMETGEGIDYDAIFEVAKSASPLAYTDDHLSSINLSSDNSDFRGLRLLVARDDCFSFCYEENMELFQKLGMEIIYFSPLKAEHLPDGDGIYLCGGYPELYAKQLEANESLRTELKNTLEKGFPCIAECGGYMYLQKQVEAADGERYNMVGYLNKIAKKGHFLKQFGYVTMTAGKDNLLAAKGDTLRAHEFHYWQVDAADSIYHMQKPFSDRGWDGAEGNAHFYGGFPHLYFPGNEGAAVRFAHKMKEWKEDSQRKR